MSTVINYITSFVQAKGAVLVKDCLIVAGAVGLCSLIPGGAFVIIAGSAGFLIAMHLGMFTAGK